MSAVVVCLDCQHYQTGGYCRKKRRDVGALNPACEKAQDPNSIPEDTEITVELAEPLPNLPPTKRCRKCGQSLPITEFEFFRNRKGDNVRRRMCKTCYSQAMSKNGKKKTTIKKEKPMETTPTKRCSKCGEEKPLTDFGANRTAKDGKQRWCKACINKATSRAKDNRSAAVQKEPAKTEKQIVVREKLTDAQMVMALRAHGWQVSCTRTITEEL